MLSSSASDSANTRIKRTFPPLYKPTGNESLDKLAFFHILERLKTQKRSGWVDHNIPCPERFEKCPYMEEYSLKTSDSISDHMYRMAILAMCMSDSDLDISKCVMMALVHDLAEAQVGDITPREGISKVDKKKLEEDAMQNFMHDMLHDSPAAQRIYVLWKEYEDGQSAEAKFVKDLDRFEMASQALEYEKRQSINLQGFFDSSIPHIQHPEVRSWAKDLEDERQSLNTCRNV